MNGLKKFQEFALNADEQKNVKGGKLATPKYRCMVSISPSSSTYSGWMSASEAISYCDSIPNCMGCESN